jgi:dipeptidyl aminopeptidase/acylaminoacyl peptidase
MQSIAPADYHDLVSVRDPQISPDGSRIAFVRQEPTSDREYESTIYTVPADGTGEPRQFTMAHGMDSQPRWSPSGDRLAFVSQRGHADRPQLWVAPTDGGEARQVTDVPGGVGSLTWAPDGNRVAFLQEVKPAETRNGHDTARGAEYTDPEPDPRATDRLVYRIEGGRRQSRTWEHYFDGARTHVYVADLQTDTVARLTDPDLDADHYAPAWSDPDTLYYMGQYQGDDDGVLYDIVVTDVQEGSTERLKQVEIQLNTTQTLSVTDDGRVAYLAEPPVDELMAQSDVYVYDPDDDQTRRLTADLDRKPVNGPAPFWGPDGEYVYFLTHDEGEMTVRRVRGDGSAPVETVFAGTHLTGLTVAADRAAVVMSQWDHPGDLFVDTLEDTSDATPTRLTEVNAEYLAERAVQQPQEVWVDNDEGDQIQGWLLTPPEFDPEKTYPAVVQVHGGPSPVMWTPSGTMWHEFQAMAHHGYVVYWSNPRGSTGYGKAFQQAVARDLAGPVFRDVMAGTDYVAGLEYVDETDLFVTGGSYGGYMTAWIVGQTDRFSAATPQRGVYDFTITYGTTANPDVREWYYGSTPWEEPELYHDHSPLSYAHEVDTPTLIIQSEHDYNCPRADAESFHRFLEKNGVETQLVLYPREGHELSRTGEPGHVVDRMERILEWFDDHCDCFDAPPSS